MDDITEALEDLIRAADKFCYDPDINMALEDAKNALGYDPVLKEKEYQVSLNIGVTGTSPETAVRHFIELIQEAVGWNYTVKDENGKTTEVETWNW